MMPNEEDYDKEDEEIQMTINAQSSSVKSDSPSSTPGPSKIRKLSSDIRELRMEDSKPFSRPADGLISVSNVSSNPNSRKRKEIRQTYDTVKSSTAIEAQQKEQERLKRLEEKAKTPTIESYMPIVYDISDDSAEEDDDMPQCLGVYKSQIADASTDGRSYPYRVPPADPWPGLNVPLPGINWPPLTNPSIPGPSYVSAHARTINKAHADEAVRIKRQNRRLKNLDSTELNDQGRLQVNQGKPDGDPDVFVTPHLAHILKPHQLGGIRFMYDNVIESVKDFQESPGFGCVLAHSMGLGKTLQIISFVDIFFRTVQAKHVLILSPVNVIQNWKAEFNKWLPIHDPNDKQKTIRTFHVFLLGDTVKTFEDRRNLIMAWKREGGVLLLGYDMFRILIKNKNGKVVKSNTSKKVLKRAEAPIVLDDDETEERKADESRTLRKALIEGPDLIICDEGHKIKTLKSEITEALSQVRTRRRIVLTGYPLQNNLLEYYCMVDFVRPNYLGSKKEFSAMFDRPIRNGQCLDSTPGDIKLAQMKIHALTKMLKGFVQRRSAHLLKKILPENKEYVIVVRKTPIQHALYREFAQYTRVEMYSQKTKYYNPLKAHAIGTKIWNHPDLLYYAYSRQLNTFAKAYSDKNQGNLVTAADKMRLLQTSINDYFQIFGNPSVQASSSNSSIGSELTDDDDDDDISGEISYTWAGKTLDNYKLMEMEHSNKMIITMELLRETIARGEKMLLFSASVLTLTLIENMIRSKGICMYDANGDEVKFVKDQTYCRFDGGTSGIEREKLIDKFNASPKLYLFLISTKAGSLGINLVSANRVIIFDASWNPCWDSQAVCRVYRYGQQKKTYVYRLIMHNSMERAIFYRQISKQGLQKKVVDELNIKTQVTKSQLEDLLKYDESLDVITENEDPNEWEIDDDVLKAVAFKNSSLIAEPPFLHESMILESEDNLSEQEKLEAELLYQIDNQRQPHPSLSSNGGNINIARNGLLEDMRMREYYDQQMAYRGSLNDLRNGLEYSEIGLNPLQYKITNPNLESVNLPSNLPVIIHHPLHGRDAGGIYRMNNASMVRGPSSIEVPPRMIVILEDIELPIYGKEGQISKLQMGEKAKLIVMSGKTYLKRISGGEEIFDATGSRYDPKNFRKRIPEVIELDDD